MSHPFGDHVRRRRETLRARDPEFSLRRVAARIGGDPAYLSKVERELDEDPDVLLALAGKVSAELVEIIRKRPRLMADLIRQMKSVPDHAVLRIVREVRDGDW